VLVLVDDLHWVDRESAAALLFAARRLHRDAVAFLFATRAGSGGAAPLEGLPVLDLTGLTPAEATGLLPGRLAEGVAARLVERTRGNPLALTEVAGRLTPAQRLGAAPLPVGTRLELVYEPLLAGLSAPAWRAVLLCAANPEGATAPLVGTLRRDGVDAAAALDEAEERGVLVRDRGDLRFRHPLLRAAAWRWPPRPSVGRPNCWPTRPSWPRAPSGSGRWPSWDRPGSGSATWPVSPMSPTRWPRPPTSATPGSGSWPGTPAA
jgi:hypothetical protein